MSDADDPELTSLLADLTTTLRDLQEEVEPDGPPRPRPPTPGELSRFTSEVAIPGLILVLKTNIRALQLLQRAIRLANGEDPTPGGSVSQMRDRAERVGRASVAQLDGVLDELQDAVEQRPDDEEARELLSRARTLREEISNQLDASTTQNGDESVSEATFEEESDPVDIDIESELQSIKDNMDDQDLSGDDDGGDDGGSDDDTDGSDEGNSPGNE